MTPGFTYRQAIEAGCFFELPLFGADDLRKAAGARGLADFLHALNFEPLDREGFLPPVAYIRRPLPRSLHLAALRAGLMIMRDEHGYAEWSQEMIPLYANWQLLSLAELDECLSGRSPLVMLASGATQLREYLSQRAEALKNPGYPLRLAQGQRDFELLLARTQSLFMPLVRGSYCSDPIFDADGRQIDDTYDWSVRELSRFDYEQAASDCGVTADDLANYHDHLVTKAERLDPVKRWRDLVDRADRRKIEELTGDVRRARTCTTPRRCFEAGTLG